MKQYISLALCVFFVCACIQPCWSADDFINEKIIFAIKKFGVKAGEASLVFTGPVTIDGNKAYCITFTASALNFYDQEKIYVDLKTFLPVRVDRDINLWGNKEKITEHYDQLNGIVKISKTVGKRTTQQVLEVKQAPLDNIYSFIYRYRRMGAFTIGETLRLNLPTKEISIRLVKKNTLPTAGKKYSAYMLESTPRKYRLWFDSSNEKIPLRIDGAVGFGNTTLAMEEWFPGTPLIAQ